MNETNQTHTGNDRLYKAIADSFWDGTQQKYGLATSRIQIDDTGYKELPHIYHLDGLYIQAWGRDNIICEGLETRGCSTHCALVEWSEMRAILLRNKQVWLTDPNPAKRLMAELCYKYGDVE